MKKILVVAVVLLLCMACLTSCDAMMQEIGKTASVSTLDAMYTELEKAEFDRLERYDEQQIAQFAQELEEEGIALEGEITGVIEGYYSNEETGHYVMQGVIGCSDIKDVETLTKFYQEMYKLEMEEGKAEIINGGWIVSITVSSLPLNEAD